MTETRIIYRRELGSRGVELRAVNYSGHTFANFFPQRDSAGGPGWYVYGRNSEKYGVKADGKGAYVMLCARPSVAPRRHPHYNVKVRRGWHTRREAQAVADYLNKVE